MSWISVCMSTLHVDIFLSSPCTKLLFTERTPYRNIAVYCFHIIATCTVSYRANIACCLPFFGFLRVSEFTTPNLTDYDQSVHLSLQDVSIDNRENPSVLKVNIKQSKTDPFLRAHKFIWERPTQMYAPYLASFHTWQEEDHNRGLYSSQRMVKASPDNHFA